jgi:glycerol-3-phosphate dehydrogenase subunit C
LSAISHGTYDIYKTRIEKNLEVLNRYVKRGYSIVASAASCGFAMKKEYPKIIGGKNAEAVSGNTFDIHEYLLKLNERGSFQPHFKRVSIKAPLHIPCHLRAQNNKRHPAELLELIPGLEIIRLPEICCGIAGTFGMKKKNYGISMGIGKELFDEIRSSGADKVVTSCGTCKMQIKEGTGKEVIHTMDLLAGLLK